MAFLGNIQKIPPETVLRHVSAAKQSNRILLVRLAPVGEFADSSWESTALALADGSRDCRSNPGKHRVGPRRPHLHPQGEPAAPCTTAFSIWLRFRIRNSTKRRPCGWPQNVPLPVDSAWKRDYTASVRRLQRHGYFILRFLATDLAKNLDHVLDSLLATMVFLQRRVSLSGTDDPGESGWFGFEIALGKRSDALGHPQLPHPSPEGAVS